MSLPRRRATQHHSGSLGSLQGADFAPASGEEESVSAFNTQVQNGEDVLRVATNLALHNLVRREGDYLEVTQCYPLVNIGMHTMLLSSS